MLNNYYLLYYLLDGTFTLYVYEKSQHGSIASALYPALRMCSVDE